MLKVPTFRLLAADNVVALSRMEPPSARIAEKFLRQQAASAGTALCRWIEVRATQAGFREGFITSWLLLPCPTCC